MDLESKFCYVSSTPQGSKDQPGSVQKTPYTQYTSAILRGNHNKSVLEVGIYREFHERVPSKTSQELRKLPRQKSVLKSLV